MTEIFYIKKGALQPYFRTKAEDSSGTAVDITGATIYCTLTKLDGTVQVNAQTAGIVVTDGTAGEFEYRWVSGDTDIAGTYEVEFRIVPASGGDFTLPVIPKEIAKVIIIE